MTTNEYAQLWIDTHFGPGPAIISEFTAAGYVAAVMNYHAAGSNDRRKMVGELNQRRSGAESPKRQNP